MKKELTIIIPNYNGENLIKECVDLLDKQNYKNFKIIVVDDGSTDKSKEIIKNLPVTLLENKQNKGFAYTVNQGIKEAKSDFVLLLNNDVFIQDPEFLTKMLNTIKQDSLIFSVSPKMIQYHNPKLIDDTGDEYTLFGWVYKRGDNQSINKYTQNSLVFSACGGSGLYRSSVLEKIGLFDEKHFAYLEDVDLGWRAQIFGYVNVYAADSFCYHIGSATFADSKRYSGNKVYLSARNNIYIIYKNMPNLQILINLPFLIPGFLIKALYFSYQGFGKEYLLGLKEGLTSLKDLKRVTYEKKNLKNYFKIEKEMVQSTVIYTKLKLKQGISKILHRLTSKTNYGNSALNHKF